MTIRALNRWRLVYLAEAFLYVAIATDSGHSERRAGGPLRSTLRVTLDLGAALWLMHDLAHGRWRAVVADMVVLAGCIADHPWAIVAGAICAAAKPETPPSPFIWNRSRV